MVSIERGSEPMTQDSAHEGSGVHDAHHFGFWIADDAHGENAFLPPERRPLTRRSIRSWTVASLAGLVVGVASLAVATRPRGSAPEPTKAQAAARIDAVPAEPAVATEDKPPKVDAPLESPPLVKDAAKSPRPPPRATQAAPPATSGRAKPAPQKRKDLEFRPAGI
jgi:hypothetical protein